MKYMNSATEELTQTSHHSAEPVEMGRRGQREAELLRLEHESVEMTTQHEKNGIFVIFFMFSAIKREGKDMKPPFGNV